MTNLRADVHAAITDNNLSSVIFVDPFLPVTRQAKRNLLVASFIALLIAVLDLEITGFLGLSAANANLGNELAQGLACLVVAYFLVTMAVHTYTDINAWQFRRERQATEPYLELIQLLERQVAVTGEQIKNACDPLRLVDSDDEMRLQIAGKGAGSIYSFRGRPTCRVLNRRPSCFSMSAFVTQLGLRLHHGRCLPTVAKLW